MTARVFPAGLAIAAAVPLVVRDEYLLYIATLILIHGILATGLNLVMGFTGQISFANAAFYGIGAYTATLAVVTLRLPFVIGIVLAIAMGGLAGVIMGFPALRLRGHYLAMATLAAGQAVQILITHGGKITKGMEGVNVPRPVYLAGVAIETSRDYFYVALVACALTLVTAHRLVAAPIGRALQAIRDGETAAVAFGVNTAAYKTLAFAASGACGGLAGALYAMVLGYIHPSVFGLLEATSHVTMVVIGGVGTIAGPMLGSVFITVLPEVLVDFPAFRAILTGLLLLIFVIALPDGLIGLAYRLVGRRPGGHAA